jgi:hypothetical protein
MSAILARLVNPVIWRIPGHAARKLFSFSLAEHGSMLDLKAAARLSPCPERRAAYVRHLLDETRHARMFAARCAELRRNDGLPSLGFPQADTEDLFEKLGEVQFLAFVHRGETRGRQQFETYRDWFARRGDDKSRAMFDVIVRDEFRHETYTRELLVKLTGSELLARAELRKAKLWEAWRSWRRAGRFLSEKVYFVFMTLSYLLLPPFALLAMWFRPARTGWVIPQNEHELEARSERQLPAGSESVA